MKKLLGLLLICMMSLMSAGVLGIDFIESDTNLGQDLFIFRSDVDRDEAQRGELIDVAFNIVWTMDASRNGYLVYASNSDRDFTQYIRNAYSSTPHKDGDSITLNVRNIDTESLSDTFCNTQVLIGGRHYICPPNKECGSLSGSGFTVNGWEIDSNHRGEIESFGSGFRLICPDVKDECLEKAGKPADSNKCLSGDVVQEIYNGFTNIDGECSTRFDVVDGCGSQTCSDGSCKKRTDDEKLIDDERCDNRYEDVCQSGNCIITTCSTEKLETGDTCIQNNDCESNICKNNECSETSKDDTSSKSLKGEPCEAPIYCDSGSILVPCVDDAYGEEGTCVKSTLAEIVKIPALDASESSFNFCASDIESVKDGECQFNFNLFWDNFMWWIVGGLSAIVLIIVAMLFIPKKEGGL